MTRLPSGPLLLVIKYQEKKKIGKNAPMPCPPPGTPGEGNSEGADGGCSPSPTALGWPWQAPFSWKCPRASRAKATGAGEGEKTMTTFSIYANASTQDTQRETKQRDLKEAGSETRTKPDTSAHLRCLHVRTCAMQDAVLPQRFPPNLSRYQPKESLVEEPSESCKDKCHNPTSSYTNRCTLGVQNCSRPLAESEKRKAVMQTHMSPALVGRDSSAPPTLLLQSDPPPRPLCDFCKRKARKFLDITKQGRAKCHTETQECT